MQRLARITGISAVLWVTGCDAGPGVHAAERGHAQAASARLEMVRPRALRRGDTIMFVAPAGDVDEKRMAAARQALEQRGYKVVERRDLYDRWGYLAGSDERRLGEMMQAFMEKDVDAIFCGGGGYGTMRFLDQLDYDVIRKNPKILIGFSDITGLHLALQRRAGLITFHGPVAESSLGSDRGMSDFTEASFWAMLEGKVKAGSTFRFPAGVGPTEALGKGKARGRLVGGNLSLVAALMGTPFEIDTQDAVLFLEDVGESAYRVDRMLTQLRLAGKLATLEAAVLGQFTRSRRRETPRATESEFSVEGVLRRAFEPLGIPVLTNFPAGHHRENATLPLGALVEVDAGRNRLTILEAPLTDK